MYSKLCSTAAVSLLIATALASPALAADEGRGSFTITVTIAPLAEAIAAQDAGAVGAWTIFNKGGGLMIQVPNQDTGKGMVVHYGERNRFQLFSGGHKISPINVRNGNGLTAANYPADQFSTTGLWTSEVTLSAL